VVGRGLLLSAIGIALGLAAAFGLTRVMTTMLVGVEPIDRQAHWLIHRPSHGSPHPHPGILESLHPLIL
jgi:hypothetical protein